MGDAPALRRDELDAVRFLGSREAGGALDLHEVGVEARVGRRELEVHAEVAAADGDALSSGRIDVPVDGVGHFLGRSRLGVGRAIGVLGVEEEVVARLHAVGDEPHLGVHQVQPLLLDVGGEVHVAGRAVEPVVVGSRHRGREAREHRHREGGEGLVQVHGFFISLAPRKLPPGVAGEGIQCR
jgi:hypothetical protein